MVNNIFNNSKNSGLVQNIVFFLAVRGFGLRCLRRVVIFLLFSKKAHEGCWLRTGPVVFASMLRRHSRMALVSGAQNMPKGMFCSNDLAGTSMYPRP